MAGQLNTHPLVKTYDETMRSKDRVKTYIEIHERDLEKDQHDNALLLVHHLEQAIACIPAEYRMRRYAQVKEKRRRMDEKD